MIEANSREPVQSQRESHRVLDRQRFAALDRHTEALGLSCSAFVRDAVGRELRRQEIKDLDRRYREGYEKFPVEPGEFDLEADTESWPEW